jgi:hypothetical protein
LTAAAKNGFWSADDKDHRRTGDRIISNAHPDGPNSAQPNAGFEPVADHTVAKEAGRWLICSRTTARPILRWLAPVKAPR